MVQRSFIAKRLVNGAGNQFETYEEWTKNLSSLGSHSSGSPLKTLDDIYREAENEWLLKRDNTTTSFHAANSGIISNCGYVENGCQDDCFRGISINAIEKI